MTRAGWVAIGAAIAFPTIALVVVLLVRPPPPGVGFPPPGPGCGPPPGPGAGPPPPLDEEALVAMREPLGLTDEQVERIRGIAGPARRRMDGLHGELRAAERALLDALSSEDVDEALVRQRLEALGALRREMDELVVLTPLRLRAVLTPEQRERLMRLWRDRRPPPGMGFPGGPPAKGPPPPLPGGG
jgi:Spy/CpxP family protein refolding chaperone